MTYVLLFLSIQFTPSLNVPYPSALKIDDSLPTIYIRMEVAMI